MEFFKKFKRETVIDAAILQCGKKLEELDPESEEYTSVVNNILTLSDAKSKTELDAKTKKIIMTYLGGILLILLYENGRVITSKAFNLITKIV